MRLVKMSKASCGVRRTTTDFLMGLDRCLTLSISAMLPPPSLRYPSSTARRPLWGRSHRRATIRLGLEGFEHVVPEAIQVAAELLQTVELHAVDPTRALPTRADQTRPLEHLEVLRYGGTRDMQSFSEPTHRLRAAPEPLEHFASGRISQRLEHSTVSHAL